MVELIFAELQQGHKELKECAITFETMSKGIILLYFQGLYIFRLDSIFLCSIKKFYNYKYNHGNYFELKFINYAFHTEVKQNKKIKPHAGFEPATFRLLSERSTN